MASDINAQMQCIDRFLADNPQLEQLSANLSTFNVFRALKIEHAEIRHSNVLAWLLDPEESHGLSDVVLRRVLSNILLLSDKNIARISAAKAELLDFSDIEVLREWRNIDILVVDRANKIVLLFENKIYSSESKDQLSKYLQMVQQEFPTFVVVPVFLTLSGYASSDAAAQDYIAYSHIQLYSLLNTIFTQRRSQLSEPVAVFLQHYLDTLRRLTMQDDDLVELCKTIYRKHREAIDLIVQYGMTSAFKMASEDTLGGAGGHEVLSSSPSSVWFLPDTWSPLLPENGVAWSHLKRPVSVCCWIDIYEETLYSHFEVCKMDDKALRLKCVTALKATGFSLTSKAFNEDATYSRFYGSKQKVNDPTDYDQMRSAIEKLLKKATAEFPKAEHVFREVFADTRMKQRGQEPNPARNN